MQYKEPYSIYADKRPLRIAYLVEASTFSFEDFKMIFELNQKKWGGAYNPIIPVNSGKISQEWMLFLKEYDPDIIECLWNTDEIEVNLEDIEKNLSPYLIRRADKSYLYREAVNILPTQENVSKASYSFHNNSKIGVFEIEDISEDIEAFLNISLGLYERSKVGFSGTYQYIYSSPVKEALENTEKKIIELNSDEDFYNFVDQQTSPYERVLFPNQLSELSDFHKEVKYQSIFSEDFIIIIGESVNDLILYNNISLYKAHHRKCKLNALWVPSSLADKEEFQDFLKKITQRFVHFESFELSKTIKLLSFSFEEEKLKTIAQKIQGTTREKVVSEKLTSFPLPEYKEEFFPFSKNKEIESFTGRSQKERISVSHLNINGYDEYKTWVADIYIEDENSDLWKMPKNNELAKLFFPKNYCRMKNNGFASIVIEQKKTEVNVSLPEDSSIFRTLLLLPQRPLLQEDLRSEKKGAIFPWKVGNIAVADKGKYFRGILNLFGGLFETYYFFEKHFWREFLSKQSEKAKLKDGLRANPTGFTLEGIKKTAQEEYELFQIEKSKKSIQVVTHQGKELSKISDEELEKIQQEDLKESLIEIEEKISDLISKKILIPGIKTHCPLCGYKNWKSIDETKQFNVCEGCSSEYSIEANPTWYYRVNNLLAMGIEQGVIPAIITLGEVLHWNNHRNKSFIYPNIDIYPFKGENKESEIDILCIQNGKFIIGEVKNSTLRFKKSDFEKMEKVAKQVRPDIVLFAGLDEKQLTKNNQEDFENLKLNLEPLGILVQWKNFPPHIFEASIGSI